LASYIASNHHLPELPPAREVNENGISPGDIQMKLLAKIEELTLHMIEADKTITRLEEQNRDLAAKVATGKSQK
jgi:hypothetical protein